MKYINESVNSQTLGEKKKNKNISQQFLLTCQVLQSWSKYFGSLQCFITDPINHK